MMYLVSPPQYWVTFDWGNFSLESLFSWIRLSTSILYGLFLLVKKIIHQFHNITSLHHIWNSTSAKVCICDPAPKSLLGLCLGYLRGRSSPPPRQKNTQLPLQKILSFQYIGNYIAKIIQTQQGHCIHCNIPQNYVSKCTRLHLSTYSFQTLPKDPLQEAFHLLPLGTSPPDNKS